MKSKFIILFILIVVAFPNVVSADLLMPGTKTVSMCHEIRNVNSFRFRDYIFLMASSGPVGPYSYYIIEKGDCLSVGYKFGSALVYAMKKTDYGDFSKQLQSVDPATGDLLKDNPKAIELIAALPGSKTVKREDPLDKMTVVWEVILSGDDRLAAEKLKTINTYTDGTVEEKAFSNQNAVPASSENPLEATIFYKLLFYIIIPAIALIVIVAIIMSRKLKK